MNPPTTPVVGNETEACRFCKSTDIHFWPDACDNRWKARCSSCGISTRWFDTEQELRDFWNNRPSPTATDGGEIERCYEALGDFPDEYNPNLSVAELVSLLKQERDRFKERAEELEAYEEEEAAAMARWGVQYSCTFLDGWVKVIDERDELRGDVATLRTQLATLSQVIESAIENCSECGGEGTVYSGEWNDVEPEYVNCAQCSRLRTALTAITSPVSAIERECPDCGGKGWDEERETLYSVPEQAKCESCDGTGKVKTEPTPEPDELTARAQAKIEEWKAQGYSHVHVHDDGSVDPSEFTAQCQNCLHFDNPAAGIAVRASLEKQEKEN